MSTSKLIATIFLLAVVVVGAYMVGVKLINNDSKNIPNISDTIPTEESEDEKVTDPNLPEQTATSVPAPTLVKSDASEMSPDECQAQGGICVYDLKCSDFGRVEDGICIGKRPNGMPVDCCKTK